MITKLYVGGLPLEMDELQLAKMIAPYGDVVTIKLVRDKVSGNFKGYAFVEIRSREAAELVVDALDGKMISGTELQVSIRADEPHQSSPGYPRVQRSGTARKTKRPRISR